MGVGSSSNIVLHWLMQAGGDLNRTASRASLTAWVTVVLPAFHLQKETFVILHIRYKWLLKLKSDLIFSLGVYVLTPSHETWYLVIRFSVKNDYKAGSKIMTPLPTPGCSSPPSCQFSIFTPLNELWIAISLYILLQYFSRRQSMWILPILAFQKVFSVLFNWKWRKQSYSETTRISPRDKLLTLSPTAIILVPPI